jgi:hypothetical protein
MQSWDVGLLWSRKGDPWTPNLRHVIYTHQAFNSDNISTPCISHHLRRIACVSSLVDVTDLIVVRVMLAFDIILGAVKPLSAPTRRSSHCMSTDTGAYFVYSIAQTLAT